MKNSIKISFLWVATASLAGCGLASSSPEPVKTVTITATPSATPSAQATGQSTVASPTPESSDTATTSPAMTPAQLMESTSTNKNISYKDDPNALVITLPTDDKGEQAYTLVQSEMSRAIRLLNNQEIGANLRKILVYSSDGMMLEQTNMPVVEPEPSPTVSFPDDHAPRGDDLIIPQPSLTPVPDAPALGIDMSLVGNEGLNDGNYEIYLKAPHSQVEGGSAPTIILKARADSLKGTSVASSIKDVRVYSSDQVLLDSIPLQ